MCGELGHSIDQGSGLSGRSGPGGTRWAPTSGAALTERVQADQSRRRRRDPPLEEPFVRGRHSFSHASADERLYGSSTRTLPSPPSRRLAPYAPTKPVLCAMCNDLCCAACGVVSLLVVDPSARHPVRGRSSLHSSKHFDISRIEQPMAAWSLFRQGRQRAWVFPHKSLRLIGEDKAHSISGDGA